MPAGNLHAYLRGFALEVMANSDNVLRGGLTPKHVDVPELLRVLDFAPTAASDLRPPVRREGPELVYETPTDEFAVALLVLDGDYLGHEIDASSSHEGPQILLCTEGSTVVHGKSQSLTLEHGNAAWVAADDGPIRLLPRSPPSCSGRPWGCEVRPRLLADCRRSRNHSPTLWAMVRPISRGGGTM